VHPIERLRFVARAGWGGPAELGVEAAYALAELAENEPAAVLPACRRLLERNPACGPLWWVAARLLCSDDPMAEAGRCARALEDDPTQERLEAALSGRRAVRHGGVAEVASADVVVVPSDALGPAGMVVDGDDRGVLEAARAAEVEVWAVAGAGRVLPARLWQALRARLALPAPTVRTAVSAYFDHSSSSAAAVDLRGVSRVAGPNGVEVLDEALSASDCPEPPELLAGW
jgi:hypothetical protein